AALDGGTSRFVPGQVPNDRVEERANALPEMLATGGHETDERLLNEVFGTGGVTGKGGGVEVKRSAVAAVEPQQRLQVACPKAADEFAVGRFRRGCIQHQHRNHPT